MPGGKKKKMSTRQQQSGEAPPPPPTSDLPRGGIMPLEVSDPSLEKAATDIANPSLPAEERLAAASRLRDHTDTEAVGRAVMGSHLLMRLWRSLLGNDYAEGNVTTSPGSAAVIATNAARHILAVCETAGADSAEVQTALLLLAELALLPAPALLGQSMSTLGSLVALIDEAGAGGIILGRASPQRGALIGALRVVLALSTHRALAPHLAGPAGIPARIARLMSIHADPEILTLALALASNLCDSGAEAVALCVAKFPRLVTRLIANAGTPSELKEDAVAALRRLTAALGGTAACEPPETLPALLAVLASGGGGGGGGRWAACREGVWGLHLLSERVELRPRLALLPGVREALASAGVRAGIAAATKAEEDADELQRIAKLTLETLGAPVFDGGSGGDGGGSDDEDEDDDGDAVDGCRE